MRDERPTEARIDLEAAAANLREAQSRAPGCALIAVVKADAYGHGAVRLSRAFLDAGCRRLAVVTFSEAAALREAGIGAPILVLGGIHGAGEARVALELGLVPVVQERAQLALLAEAVQGGKAGAPLPVQVEIDSGMARMGVPAGDAQALLRAIHEHPSLTLEGVFTHLARADEADLAPTLRQLGDFDRLLGALDAEGIPVSQRHVANSAGVLAGAALGESLPASLNAVRPGLMLYGVSPAPHLEASLRPVMTLQTRVVAVRAIERGAAVGYGASWRAQTPGAVATLPLGYADGIPWSLANRGEVAHRGRRRPIVGRISMDYVTVFCPAGEVAVGDPVVMFGAGGPSVEEVARAAGTIPYELLVRVGSRVPRIHRPGD